MHLHEVQQQIISKDLDKLYIFTGEEIGVMDIYIDKIAKSGEYEINRFNTVKEVYPKLTQRRMTGNKRCFVVFDDKSYLKEDKIWETVKQACEDSKDMLIIRYTKLDKRSKFYKKYKNKLVEFEKLKPMILAKYIQNEIELSKSNAELLAGMSGHDYNRCMLECDKIKQYFNSGINKNIKNYDDAFIYLKEQGVIHQPIGDITFKFTDAIATRDYNNTCKYLAQAKAKREPEIMVLSILYNTFKQILMVQGLGRNKTNASARTGLTGWQVKMAMNKLNYYSIGELVDGLKLIRKVEKGIKTGQIDIESSLDYLIVNLL